MPEVHPSKGAEAVQQLEAALKPLVQQYREAMDKIKFKEGLRTCMAISSLGNKFFQVCADRFCPCWDFWVQPCLEDLAGCMVKPPASCAEQAGHGLSKFGRRSTTACTALQ